MQKNTSMKGLFTRLWKMAAIMAVAFSSSMLNAAVITHNIGTGSLIIPEYSTDDYIITGSTTNHYVQVQLGYHGSITLQNCSFNFSGYGADSPIRIVGMDGQSNEHPLTVVNLILEGHNTIQNNGGGRACIQVDQGAQINISAIDPCDNNSGILIAKQLNDSGGAAIGSLVHYANPNETTATASLSNGGTGTTAGGNIVISSGTITARGGHGAGIGGGYTTYYDGMIVIYGGVVNATADFDAAGIGSGCPEGTGVIQVFTPHSAVIALPPAVISAKGAGATASGGVGHNLFSELGLAGTKVRVYIGDPGMTNCPIGVYTDDHIPNANIYVDLSQDPDIYRVVTATVDPSLLDIHQVFFGTTGNSGVYSTTGKLNNNTTFFTDAISVSPSSYGHPYLPKVATLPTGGNVQLDKLMADFRIETFPSTMLAMGYSSSEALEKATCVKLVYNDPNPIENVQFDLANGAASDFDNLVFLASDSTTLIPAPTTLSQGETYYIIIPIQTGKEAYLFSDVLRIIGVWQGASTSYIRQIVTQIVGYVHTEYICSGDSYWFYGEELTEPGMYSNVTTTTSQCQALSIVEILNLVVNFPVTSSFEATHCDKYVWNGIEYTSSGQYEQVLHTQTGCDSIVTLYLSIYELDTTYSIEACDEYWWYGQTYTRSGRYEHLGQTSSGCDSLEVLNLTINKSTDTYESVVSCDGYEWRGTFYTEPGTYQHEEGQTVHGCDSVAWLELSLNYTPDIKILGYSQVAHSSNLWHGIYYYYVVDSLLLEPGSVSWTCSNPSWIMDPVGDFGCRLIVKERGEGVLNVETGLTTGCDTQCEFWINATDFGVEEDGIDGVLVYPNPASSHVTIGAGGLKNIRIFNALGQLVKEMACGGDDKVEMDISGMERGAYIVEVHALNRKAIKRLLVN